MAASACLLYVAGCCLFKRRESVVVVRMVDLMWLFMVAKDVEDFWCVQIGDVNVNFKLRCMGWVLHSVFG